jgi:hypothetical protein
MRTRSAALIATPSMLGGVLAAHALAYRWTVPAGQRAAVLRDTGHTWQAYLPFVVASALALLAVGLVRHTASRRARPAAWPFAVLPPLGFLLQEHLERLFHDGTLHLALTTPVVAGVLLAVPFGLAAYAVARALLGLSDAVARALAPRPPRLLAASAPACFAVNSFPRTVALGARSGRGPPRAR